jgi:hypothetical protein
MYYYLFGTLTVFTDSLDILLSLFQNQLLQKLIFYKLQHMNFKLKPTNATPLNPRTPQSNLTDSYWIISVLKPTSCTEGMADNCAAH